MPKTLRNRLVPVAAILATVGATVITITTTTASASTTSRTTTTSRTSERPPECELVPIWLQGHPRAVWIRWCGTGSGGEQPMEPGVAGTGGLQGDGTTSLSPSACPRTNPCVVGWPASPQS